MRKPAETSRPLLGEDALAVLPDAAIVIHAAGDIVQGSAAVADALGFPVDELLGKPARTIFASERDYQRALVELESEQPPGATVDLRYRCRDGQVVIGSTSHSRLKGPDGQPGGYLLILRDVTQRRRREARLSAFTQDLKALHHLQTRQYRDLAELIRSYLAAGREIFGLETGLVSHVVGDRYLVEGASTDYATPRMGDAFHLSHTYCQAVVDGRGSVAYGHASARSEMVHSQAFKTFRFESYIGTPIFVQSEYPGFVHGDVYGTLCFGSHRPRTEHFAEYEFDILELMAESIGRFIAMQQSELRTRTILHSVIDGIFTVDDHGVIESANRAVEQMFGRPISELVGANVSILIPEPHRSCHDEYLRHYRQTGYSRIIGSVRETVAARADGTTFPIELAVSEARIGSRHWFTGIVRDITQRRNAQRALEESEKRYRDLFENANDLIQIAGLDGRVAYANAAWKRTLGYEDGDLQHITVGDLVHPSSIQTWEQAFTLALAGKNVDKLEAIMLTNGGEEICIEGSLNAMFEHGQAICTRGIFRDVTERKEVDRMKDEFVSVVSHELRTPLTSIRGSLGLMEGGIVGELPDKALDMVRIARSNTDRLIRLINTILDLEKIEAGKIELHLEHLRPETVIVPAYDALNAVASHANVSLDFDDVDSNLRFEGDRDRLVQVLTNLAGNAVKFSPSGGTVHIACSADSDTEVVFSVQDNGPGIAQEDQQELFSKFHQLDSSDTRPQGGTGLGLAISRAIVEQHGGTIGVESGPGRGARFFFRLRRVPNTGDNEPVPREPLPIQSILLVEDDQELAEVIQVLLTRSGYAVDHAPTLEAAQSYLRSHRPRAILLDIGLPDGSGMAILGQLAAMPPGQPPPVVVLSGRDPEKASLSLPFLVDWLTKPSDESSLRATLRRAIRGSRGPRVLVVEDDVSTRRVLAAKLGALGIICLEAGSGERALAIASSEDLDLIILDVRMQGMDGFEVVEQLRKSNNRTLPLLVYTGVDLGAKERGRLTLGMSRHLTKAKASTGEFVAAVADLLGRSARH